MTRILAAAVRSYTGTSFWLATTSVWVSSFYKDKKGSRKSLPKNIKVNTAHSKPIHFVGGT